MKETETLAQPLCRRSSTHQQAANKNLFWQRIGLDGIASAFKFFFSFTSFAFFFSLAEHWTNRTWLF